MDESNAPERARYYAEAASWAQDIERSRQRSARLAWGLAIAALVVAICEAIALIAITPLKTVVPYTLLVDRQTGHVEALDPIRASTIAPDTALTRSFLAQYVIARESFAFDTLQADYRKVALWSARDARRRYVASMQASYPGSPLNLLPRRAIVQTRIKSVSSLGPDSALVRFETYRADQTSPVATPWVAVISYRYSDAPLDMESRLLNPLGFQVTRYRRDAEAPPPPAAPRVLPRMPEETPDTTVLDAPAEAPAP